MARMPGLDLVRNVTALVIIGAIVTVGAISLAGRSAPSGAVAGSPSPDAAAAPSQPTGDVVAYTNPDGISPAGFENHDYPFVVQAQALPTYGVLWIDDNQRDFHIAVTGDIAGAIEFLKDGIPRGITVYFYLAQHTHAELCALWDKISEDREELITHGIVLGGGCGNREMRVQVVISPFTPEVVAYMEARYPGPVDFLAGGRAALRQYDPPQGLEVRLNAVLEDDGFGWLTCGGQPFPDTALDSGPVDMNGNGPALEAFRESLATYAGLYGDLAGLSWILAAQDDYAATFLVDQGHRWLEAPVFAGRGEWVPGTIDDCSPREFTSDDYETAEWRLDPAFPAPKPDSFEIHVLVTERACASGEVPLGRVVPPVVTYSADKLRMAIGVRHLGGPATCPSNDSLAVTVLLPEPLGDRDLSGAAAPRF